MLTFRASFHSPIGCILIVTTETNLIEVTFSDAIVPRQVPEDTDPPVLHEAFDQLEAYFEGSKSTFDLSLGQHGTDFQQRVWSQLTQIPCGNTLSYRALAIQLGDEKCIRAAGLANGRNKIAVVVPCHRVIGSNGMLIGYAGGLWRKQWLLEHERSMMPVPPGMLF